MKGLANGILIATIVLFQDAGGIQMETMEKADARVTRHMMSTKSDIFKLMTFLNILKFVQSIISKEIAQAWWLRIWRCAKGKKIQIHNKQGWVIGTILHTYHSIGSARIICNKMTKFTIMKKVILQSALVELFIVQTKLSLKEFLQCGQMTALTPLLMTIAMSMGT